MVWMGEEDFWKEQRGGAGCQGLTGSQSAGPRDRDLESGFWEMTCFFLPLPRSKGRKAWKEPWKPLTLLTLGKEQGVVWLKNWSNFCSLPIAGASYNSDGQAVLVQACCLPGEEVNTAPCRSSVLQGGPGGAVYGQWPGLPTKVTPQEGWHIPAAEASGGQGEGWDVWRSR